MRYLFLLLCFAASGLAASCRTGFASIADNWSTPSGTLFTGTVTATRADISQVGTVSVRAQAVSYSVVNGRLDWCLAPGTYTVSTAPAGATTSWWTVPAGAGPYKMQVIETGTVGFSASCSFTPTTTTLNNICVGSGSTCTTSITYVTGGSVGCSISPSSMTFSGGFKQ